MLDLTPDSNLFYRLVDVRARFGDIDCDPATLGLQACVPPGCPTGALLVDSQTPAASWLLAKISAWEGTTPIDLGCGDSMPLPSSQGGYSEEHRGCLKAMVYSFARIGRERAGP